MRESMDADHPSEERPAGAGHPTPQPLTGGVGVVAEFRVSGLTRYLSHAELMRVFQRACVRAGLALDYSHGYNPRPRISLPLPKPVGVESTGDLLCVRLLDSGAGEEALASEVAGRLSGELPGGLEILSVRVVPRKASFQAAAADYRFSLKNASLIDEVREKAAAVLASPSCVVDRRDGDERAPRPVDVRPFLASIEVAGQNVSTTCWIRQSGSVRSGELLELLGLTKEQLAGPIQRTAIQWRQGAPEPRLDADRP
jgi:radical SAM-linked protein